MIREQLWEDLRYAFRQLRRSPGFALAAVLTLALGIGANTAIFSVVESVLLRPLPYANGDQLVHIGPRTGPGQENIRFSVQELADYQRQNRSFSAIIEYHTMTFSLVGRGEPDRVKTGVVSGNFFAELGVRPLLGRLLTAGDDRPGADAVLILTNRYWQTRFGGDPSVVGQTLRLNNRLITVVGVLPPLPLYPGDDDIIASVNGCAYRSGDFALHHRSFHIAQLFGRLRPGVTLAQAQSDVETISKRLHQDYPDAYAKYRDPAVPVVPIREELTSTIRPVLVALLATVALVLLIACGNLANLNIARLLSRQREMALRSALGADRRRLVRQLLTESTLLSLLGGALGLLLANLSMRLLVAFSARFTARAAEVGIDLWVLLFALFVSVVTGLLFGSLPALQVTRQDLAPTLKEGGSRTTLGVGGNRVRSLLVVLQVAASFVLLVGAGLTLRSAMKLQHVDTGVDPEHLLTATITLPYTKYPDEPPMRVFFRRLIDQLATHPGVLAVAVSNDNPLGNAEAALNPNFKIEGQPTDPRQQQPQGSFHMVTPEYFHTLRIPMIEGRTFTLRDVAKAPLVAVVNQSLARQYFPNQSPLGHRIALTNQGGGMWCTIVGVVGDVKQHGVGNAAGPGIYYTWEQAADGQGELLVRTSGDPLGLVGDVRAAVHGLDQEQPITNVQTLDQMRSGEVAPARLTATLLGLFALLAFVITATGVSAVIAFFVSERTQEIGIRSALGADRGDVVALVLRQAMGLVALGLGVGAVVALMLTGLLRSLLFDVEPTDPLTFVLIAAMLLAVVAIACMVPARRAMRIDPVVALRS